MSTLLEDEIASQGSVLRERAAAGGESAARAARALGAVDHLVIAARGSSDNAARYAQYLCGDALRLEVGLAAPWLYRDPDRAPKLAGAGVIGISQSGQSPDIVAVLAAARAQGRPTVALTNDAGSPLAREADVVVPLLAGAERSVAATKTFLASLHAVAQLVEHLAPDRRRARLPAELPDLLDDLTVRQLDARAQFDPLFGASLITVTGRGLAFSAAHESALKLRELSGMPAEAFSPPDLMHGPLAALRPSGAAWLVDPSAADLAAIAPRTGTTVVVADRPHPLDGRSIQVALPPDLPPSIAAILAVVPAQVAGLRLAEAAGIDVDRPWGLHKVTLTS
ncbi:MAG: SIS domain-containing protein [Actinobacteria bacterium]|nr:SIS domain-containing protein [Actinomycetota bacterium]